MNVVVTDHQHQVLTEMAKLQRRSASSIIREMLDTTIPLFEASLVPLRAASEAIEKQPQEARRILSEAFGAPNSVEDTEPALLSLIEHLTALASRAEPARTERSEGAPVGTDQVPHK